MTPSRTRRYCLGTCKKTNLLTWLYHLVGLPSDKGRGWAKCKGTPAADVERPDDWGEGRTMSDETRAKLRKQFNDLVAQHVEPAKKSRRLSGEGVASDDEEDDDAAPESNARRKLTPEIREQLTELAAMRCYEGGIAAHALGENQADRELLKLALSAWDDGGTPWTPPTRKQILGKLLRSGYFRVKDQIMRLANPRGFPWVLTVRRRAEN